MTAAPRWLRAQLVAGAVAALALAPRIAEACPYCAGRTEEGIGRGLVIGAMVFAPFAAVGIAVPLLLRLLRRADPDGEDGRDGGQEGA
jgi:hypothetical protein